MSGCYGDSAEDRYFENQLNNYLDSFDEDESDDTYDPDDHADHLINLKKESL